MNDIPTSELEYLANSESLRKVFQSLEQDAYEEFLRLPIWASRKRRDALVQRIQVIRDVQQQIAFLKATSKG